MLKQWEEEINKFVKDYTYWVQHGRERFKVAENFYNYVMSSEPKIILTTYSTFRNDVRKGFYDKNTFLFRVILDEAHEIRNYEKSQYLDLLGNLNTLYRWAITGTPIQNRYGDLFALLKFLKVRPYGEFNAWYRMIEYPLIKPSTGLKQNAVTLLKQIISTLVLRRTKMTHSEEVRQKHRLEKGQIVSLLNRDGLWTVENVNTQSFDVENTKTKQKDIVPFAVFNDKQKRYQPTYQMLDVLVPLPEKFTQIVNIPLNPKERALYDKLLKEASLSVKQSYNITTALTFLLRLRQLATHPLLVDDIRFTYVMKNTDRYVTSSKLTKVRELVEKATIKNEKCLVFSLYTKTLDLIELELLSKRWCDKNAKKNTNEKTKNCFDRIDGSMQKEHRQIVIDRFKTNPNVKVLLCSLRATAVGLNLVEANNVIFVDLDFNPQMHAQAIDRAHRMGQTKDVNIYFLLSENTIDQKIYNLMEYKESLSSTSFREIQFGKHLIMELLK